MKTVSRALEKAKERKKKEKIFKSVIPIEAEYS